MDDDIRQGGVGDFHQAQPGAGVVVHPEGIPDARQLSVRDVALERVDEPAVGAQQLLALDALGVPDDDRLAAPEIQAGRGCLEGHPSRQPQDIAQGFLVGAEWIEARTAEGGPEGGRVDGDNCPEVRGRVVEEHDLLVFTAELVEDSHFSVRQCSKRPLSAIRTGSSRARGLPIMPR